MPLKNSNPLKREYILHMLLWGSVLLFPYIKFMELDGGYPETFLHELNSFRHHPLLCVLLLVAAFDTE